MESCSANVYIRSKVKKQFKDANYVGDDKEEEVLSCSSDELNDDFDSGDEEESKYII